MHLRLSQGPSLPVRHLFYFTKLLTLIKIFNDISKSNFGIRRDLIDFHIVFLCINEVFYIFCKFELWQLLREHLDVSQEVEANENGVLISEDLFQRFVQLCALLESDEVDEVHLVFRRDLHKRWYCHMILVQLCSPFDVDSDQRAC